MARRLHTHALLAAATMSAIAAWPNAAEAFALAQTHRLATLTGIVKTSWAGLSYDRGHRELYVLAGGLVRVFNEAAMEVYRFGDDEALGMIHGVAPLDDGDLAVLSYSGTAWKLLRVDFRGTPVGEIVLSGVPAGFEGFGPSTILAARSQLYLADFATMKVLVARPDGAVVASHDLAPFGEPEAKDGDEKPIADDRRGDITGFGVGPDGDLLFTIATKFKAYVLSPDGTARSFGAPGGSPGKFGIATGIAEDDAGRVYVTDTLKAVVMVFDRDLKLLGEYGYTGRPSERLVGPRQVAVGAGKVFVAQNGLRGVSVFAVRE